MIEQYPVLPGAEPFFYKGNHIGILICHGFVGTPQSVGFLGEQLAAKGFSVYGVRLRGHGTHYEDLEKCSYQDWIESIEDGYYFLQKHCQEIFVIGQSMGGTLTLNLTNKHRNIKGIILINAAIKSIPPMEKYKNSNVPRYINEGKPDIKDKSVNEITYSKAPVRSIQQLFALMDKTRDILPTISCPVMAFQSEEDHVVPPENGKFLFASIHSDDKEFIPLTNSYHVASMDFEKELIAEKCSNFIIRHANNEVNTE
ncbi:alpha/beta hydrolase [Neobacillus niacini]|uniref:alpha/beta hydrolase n=1 Tax=Neobacillus niacini TaxID=86668 RepID=UPI0039835EBB